MVSCAQHRSCRLEVWRRKATFLAGCIPIARRRGATLVELVVAFGILVPIVVVALGIFPFSHVLNRQAWALAAAYDIALTRIEDARGQDFDSLVPSSTTQEEREGIVYTCTTTVSAYGVSVNPVRLKKVTVVVSWTDKHAEQIRMDSLLARTASS